MKTIRSLLQGIIVLTPMVVLGQVDPPAAKDGAASETPPEGIVAHRDWCDQADTPAQRLRRLEGFWATRLPESEGGAVSSGHPGEYEDGLEWNYIRGTAYALAEAYAEAGDKTGSKLMLHYLKWTDPADLWNSIGSPFYDGRAILKPGASLSLTLLEIRAGFEVPECVWWDAEGERAVVSNISSEPDEYWTNDGKGFIGAFEGSPEGPGKDLPVLVESKPDALIHGPKGMCRLGGHLYFTDNTRLMRVPMAAPTTGQDRRAEVVAEGFQKTNDLASDGEAVWMSDTGTGQVFRFSPDGKYREIPAPAGVNGLTFHDGHLFAVSWSEHEIYELDPAGKNPPQAFGLAAHFVNLDGLEVLDDGTFLVSDFPGNKVCAIAADRETVTTLIELATPADIGLDRENGILFIPQLKHDRVVVLRLVRGVDS